MPFEGDQLKPSDYLRIARRSKLTILAVVVVVVGIAVGVSLAQRPVYQAMTQVLVRQGTTSSLFSSNPVQPLDPSRNLETEIRVINGPEVQEAVRAALNVSRVPTVSVTAVKDADVIQISARSRVPASAAAAANGFAKAYIDLRRQQAADELLDTSREIQARITDLQSQIDMAIGPERDVLLQAQALFRQKLGEAQVGGANTNGRARVIVPAKVPTAPVSPNPRRTGLWAACLGLALGLGIAFLRDFLDSTIRTSEDLERATPDLAAVGLIPRAAAAKGEDAPRVLALTDPHSATAEAFRTLRTAITFLGLEKAVRIVQITSPSTGEGKTTIVANLGVALAQAGQRVVIVCCDLRRPRISKFFGLENEQGLTSVMAGETKLGAVIRKVDSQLPLYVLTAGPTPPNPAELLASDRASAIFNALREKSDIILLDCPPVLPVADSLVVSSYVDISLMVCQAGTTSQQKLTRAIQLMRQVNAPLAGTILNGVSAKECYGESYEY